MRKFSTGKFSSAQRGEFGACFSCSSIEIERGKKELHRAGYLQSISSSRGWKNGEAGKIL
jgi:hypothetical protein